MILGDPSQWKIEISCIGAPTKIAKIVVLHVVTERNVHWVWEFVFASEDHFRITIIPMISWFALIDKSPLSGATWQDFGNQSFQSHS